MSGFSSLFDRDDAGEVFPIALVDLARGVIRRSCLGANQCMGAANMLGDVSAVAPVAVDYPVEVLATIVRKGL